MNQPIQLKPTAPSITDLVTGCSLRCPLILIGIAFICFALAPMAKAVSPPPDGGYPNGNTAEGTGALFSLTTGIWNTALGFQTLYHDSSGNYNTAVGTRALFSNISASQNTATGAYALYSNSSGHDNTANGFRALDSNTIGTWNTANGARALDSNTTGSYNTANGVFSLLHNSTGIENTAVGVWSLSNNTTGSWNIGLGFGAGSYNSTGSYNIDIGNNGVAGESNTIRIGTPGSHTATYIAGIYGVTIPAGAALPVIVSNQGQLGTASSSKRFKKEIKPMTRTSETILALKPVTFQYKSDKTGTPQFGLVAEDVAEVNPDLVACDNEGEIFTVRYDAVNVMLLNEFLKEHAKLQELKATVARQRKRMDALVATVEEQAAQIREASAQLQLIKSAPQIVDSNH